MSELIYKIRNLNCGYQPERVVLRIDQLDIPKGKLIFVVGESGGGKSTLIETLGLMNHTTLYSDKTGQIDFYTNQGQVSLLKTWDLPSKELAAFRQEHFSFIFQSTNLMPNFTGGENMLITALLAGQEMEPAKKLISSLMKQIGLRPRAFTADIRELSGGQRQRLAFIRAIVSNYSVLFGDEPTGNLDPNTARQCFDVLQKAISKDGKTAVIVSHDLRLATEYADLIVPIKIKKTSNGTPQGFIDISSRLYRDATGVLVTENGVVIPDPANYLQSKIFQPIVE